MGAWGLSQCHQGSPGSVHLMLLQLSPVEKGLAHSAPRSLWSPHSLRGARCHGGLRPLPGMRRESLGRAKDAPPGPCPASLDQDCGLPLSLSERVFIRGSRPPAQPASQPSWEPGQRKRAGRPQLCLLHSTFTSCLEAPVLGPPSHWSTRPLEEASGRCARPLVWMRGQGPGRTHALSNL